MNANTPIIPRNPVLLVHGIDDTDLIFDRMTTHLRRLGWNVHTLNLLPNNGDRGLDFLAQQIVNYVSRRFPRDRPIDLVGFSMGGIVSRYYIQRLGGADRVQRFVTIASPHNGTWTAFLRTNTGAMQMQPNSEFLLDLNRDFALLEQINFTSIWSPLDLMIVPAYSSCIAIGEQVPIPIPFHPWMVLDDRCLSAVASALAKPLKYHQSERVLPLQKSLLDVGSI